jgi:drug/metabolite transporter (DMT)-like permease
MRRFRCTVTPRSRDAALVILASVFWGTSFPASKVVVETVNPLFVTFARLGIGALLGFVVLSLLGRLDLRFLKDPWVWGLGLLNAAAFDLQNSGIALTTASKTALLVNVNIVFIAVLMVLVYKEAISSYKVAGIVLGLMGVVVLATKLNLVNLTGGQFVGDALVFVSGILWAFYVIGTKRMVDRGGDYVALTTCVLAATSVLAAGPLLVIGGGFPSQGDSWIGIAYLGLVPTFTPLLFYTMSMRTISPTISALLVLLEVVVAAVLSFLFLKDILDGYTLAGGALILAGAYVVARGERTMPEPGAAGLAPVPSKGSARAGDGITRR